MKWKNILKHSKVSDVKFVAKAAGNPVFKGLTKKLVEDFIRKELKEYNADVVINKLKTKSGSKMLHIHLDADVELDHEGMSKILEKIELREVKEETYG